MGMKMEDSVSGWYNPSQPKLSGKFDVKREVGITGVSDERVELSSNTAAHGPVWHDDAKRHRASVELQCVRASFAAAYPR